METVKSFAIGGKETYAAQKYSVDYVENLPAKYEKVSVICIDLEPEYYEVLPSGVHSYGLRIYTRNGHKKLLALLADIDPTHIVLRSPNLPVLCWAINRKVDIFPNLADSFSVRGLVSWYKVRKLKKALNNSHIKFVSNHNVIASKNLVDIGVNPDKIIPWDWPSAYSPDNFPIREKPYDDSHIKLLYVGSLIISKGVGDYIDAISLLTKSLNVRFTLNIVGTGSDTNLLKEKCHSLQLHNDINFVGKVSNSEIIKLMGEHDIIVVPSQSIFPEGLPMVIYEALCSRTPLILSSHPMFISRLNKSDALFFEQSNPASLAATIKSLIQDQNLYKELSLNSKHAWEKIQCPVKWADMIENWLINTDESLKWLNSYTLDNYNYKL